MIDFLPRLTQLRAAKPSSDVRRIVVFIHGIFSSHSTFDTLVESFTADPRFRDYDLAAYDYDWGEPILESARRLRDILNARVPTAITEVTLIGHSMGGLVSRFALIGGDLPSVRRIFMLGTPNFGALTARQLSVLWQTTIAGAGSITPIFPRKAGLRDLTQPQTLYKRVVKASPRAPARARGVEYVTIPGLFYHEERRDTDPGLDTQALPFTLGGLAVRAMALWPFGQIEIDRPHDGIVEEASVSLIPRAEGRVSEKNASIREPAKLGRTYAHVSPDSMHECAHMGIQRDVAAAEVIKGIMLAGGAVAWKDALTADEHDTFISIEIPG